MPTEGRASPLWQGTGNVKSHPQACLSNTALRPAFILPCHKPAAWPALSHSLSEWLVWYPVKASLSAEWQLPGVQPGRDSLSARHVALCSKPCGVSLRCEVGLW